jgi:uncharacterized protein (UPF0548 family)
VFTLRRLDADHLDRFLAEQREAALTYAEVGATCADALPAGYHHVRASTDVGAGDAVWTRARAGIREWVAHAAAGFEVVPHHAPIATGETVAVLTRTGPVHVAAACRIVAVVDEPDRYGFAYGTLPPHPEEGEERFVVTRDPSGAVRFEVVAFSRPHDLITKLGGPLPRHLQRRATTRYQEGMRAFVADRPS